MVKAASILPTLEILDDDECLDCPFEEEIEEYYRKKNQRINTDMVAPFGKKERKIKTKRVTRIGEFNRLYEECKERKVKEQKKYLMEGLRHLFKSLKATENYVDKKLMDKYRALVERRKRFMRKAYMNNFDYKFYLM